MIGKVLAGATLFLAMGAALAQPYPPAPPAPGGGAGGAALGACRPDVQMYCQGIPPGKGRIRICLQANRDRLSPACRAAIVSAIERRQEMRRQRDQRIWGVPPAPPAPPPPR